MRHKHNRHRRLGRNELLNQLIAEQQRELKVEHKPVFGKSFKNSYEKRKTGVLCVF